jgi:hypothetical protein
MLNILLRKPRESRARKYKTLQDLLANTVTTHSGCMEWKGTRDKIGYGRTWHDGRSGYKAHRLAMKLAGYDIEGWIVCHKCDNPPCCNPLHLFLGTHADNMHDAQAKGRMPIAKPKPPPRNYNIPAIHGTKAMYQNGCKCQACVDANAKYIRDYRERKRNH